MASVETFGANTAIGPHEYKLPLINGRRMCTIIQISVFSSCPGATFRDNWVELLHATSEND